MLREIGVFIYLLIFRIIFTIFKSFPQQDKVTCVAAFGDNIKYVANTMSNIKNSKIIILKKAKCRVDFQNNENQHVLKFETFDILDYILSVYHLATSKIIFIDNYFGFLSAANFQANVICIQLWHAAGAIKQFGLKDRTIKHRTKQAYNRFKKVYERFSYVVVGSENMSDIFQKCFGLSNNNILRTGIPRTDFFFNKQKVEQTKIKLLNEFPIIQRKKVILYAPTFRDWQLNDSTIALDIEAMYKQLKDEYVLLLRLHPAVNGTIDNKYPDFVLDVSKYKNVNHILLITDILITDYSSIPFEYALLEKPMIFYMYDLEEYMNERGFLENYQQNLPGPIVYETNDIIKIIRTNRFDIEKVKVFSQQWNQYSYGNSSENIIQFIYSQLTRVNEVNNN